MNYPRLKMLYQDYEWTEMNTCPATLNRKEGFEVQSFINEIDRTRFGCKAGFSILQKLERMIREYVSLGLKNQKQVLRWMIDNYTLID